MKKMNNPKRTAAIICLALILLSYIALIVVSLTDSSKSGELFQACLLAAVFLPILCWIYIWLYGQVKKKHTMADPDLFQTGEQSQNPSSEETTAENFSAENPLKEARTDQTKDTTGRG